jgi:hypothetical protein
MTEYLKKSDVMAVFDNNSGFILDMRRDIDALPTFPDPSLAVDGDLISRKGLKDEILSQYPEITVEWDAAFNALLRIINSMPSLPPAPSVDDVKPAPLKLEAGKLYRTRDGRKAFIAHISPNSPYKSAHGCMEESTSKTSWYLDGSFADEEESRHDLISLWDEPAPESGNSKLLEMIAKAEWLNVKVVNPKELAMNVCFIRDSIAEVCNGMREIARLLAERGDK